MSRNKLLTKIERYYFVVLSSIPLAILTLAFILQKSENLVQSTFFLIYFIFVCFSLPSLLSKIIFKQNFFSLTSVLCFLYFPMIYLLGIISYHLYGIDFERYYFLYGLLTIFLWHILISIFFLKHKIYNVEKTFLTFLFALIPFIIFLVVIALVRDYGSIISTDILTHKTVLNGMQDPNTFGLMPATYSNTFTGQGYPIVMYHTFLYMLSNAFNFQYHLVGFFVDIFLTLMLSLVILRFFTKHYGPFWAILGTTLALLTFENLAYTAHFFIPQTLTFLFFLKIISNKELNFKELLLSGFLLTLTHLFIGPFLTGFLFLKYIYIERKLLKKGEKNKNFLLFETFLLFSFIVLLSSAGFSIEKYFQKETIDWFGNLSNPEFLNKLPILFNLLGGVWILTIPAFFRILIKKKRSMPELTGYFGILISIAVYFLSPIFASKFFLGFGIFTSLILISWFKGFNFPKLWLKITFAITITVAFAFNFSTQFLELTRFLEQDNGVRSALVEKDERLTTFWNFTKPECVLISDPQTQLIIHSVGEGITARGMFMTLESRTKLANFIREPSQKNLIKVIEMEEMENIKNEKICIGISQRLIEMAEKNQAWEKLISTYQVDHKNEYLEINHPVIKLLDDYPRVYLDDYHAVFLVRGKN